MALADLLKAVGAAVPGGPSPYRNEFLREQQVLPSLGHGLPRIIRAVVTVRTS